MLHVLILFCFFRTRPLQEKVNLERVMNRLGTLITIVHFVDVDSAIWCKHCLVHILFLVFEDAALSGVCVCVCLCGYMLVGIRPSLDSTSHLSSGSCGLDSRLYVYR